MKTLVAKLVERVALSAKKTAVFQKEEGGIWRSYTWREVGADVTRASLLMHAEGVQENEHVWLIGRNSYELWCLDLALQSLGAVVVSIPPDMADIELESIAKATKPARALLLDGAWSSDRRKTIGRWNFPFWDATELFGVASCARPQWRKWTAMAKRKATTASILHTSGTTGFPRSVALTHAGILFQLHGLKKRLGLKESDLSLSVVPTAHVMGRLESYLPIETGGAIAFCQLEDLATAFVERNPTFFIGVPKIFDGLLEKCASLETLSTVMGTGLRFAVSGGAPLSVETALFFARKNLPIVEGYGMTEAGGAIALGDPKKPVIGQIGEAFPGMEVRCDKEGQVWIRGESVFSGYLEEESNDDFRGGWFRTGDVGTWGSKRLSLHGRSKDLIVTTNGKKIAPQKLETLLCTIPGVSQAVVFGEGEKYITAVLSTSTPANEEEIQRAVAKLNETLSPYERIRKFKVLDVSKQPLEKMEGTGKVRRERFFNDHKELIRTMYRDGNDHIA